MLGFEIYNAFLSVDREGKTLANQKRSYICSGWQKCHCDKYIFAAVDRSKVCIFALNTCQSKDLPVHNQLPPKKYV